MSVTRIQIFPQRVQDERQAVQDIIETIEAALRDAVYEPNEHDYIKVEFDRKSPNGTDLFSSYVLDPVIKHFQVFGWQFEHPSSVSICLGDNNDTIVFFFV